MTLPRWLDPDPKFDPYNKALYVHRYQESARKSRQMPTYRLAVFRRNMQRLRQSHCDCGATWGQCSIENACCVNCDHLSDLERINLSMQLIAERLYKPKQVIDDLVFLDLPQDMLDLLNTLDTVERIRGLFNDVTTTRLPGD